MFFQKLFGSFFPETGFTSLHIPCARVPLSQLFTDELVYTSTVSLLLCLLLAVISLWFGPLFCGRLCPAGAFGEFLSSLLNDKYKIDWIKYFPINPVRYGFFIGFIFSSWIGIASPCIYCNYYAFELFVSSLLTFTLPMMSASLLLTFFMANIMLGLFTKGGRGYCNFLCPIGTASSLFHIAGQYLPGPFKMQVNAQKCISCQKCANICPMRAITVDGHKAEINITRCIICGKCSCNCPVKAITYSSNLSREK